MWLSCPILNLGEAHNWDCIYVLLFWSVIVIVPGPVWGSALYKKLRTMRSNGYNPSQMYNSTRKAEKRGTRRYYLGKPNQIMEMMELTETYSIGGIISSLPRTYYVRTIRSTYGTDKLSGSPSPINQPIPPKLTALTRMKPSQLTVRT